MGYIKSIDGYIIDVPELWLKSLNGHRFHFNKLSSADLNLNINFMEINGGDSTLPIAYLPGQSTIEMSFESAQFTSDLFTLAVNQEFKKTTVTMTDTYEGVVNATTNKLVLETPYALKGTGVSTVININGLVEDETAAAGKFVVADSTGGTDGAAYQTEITFDASDNLGGETIYVYVDREVADVDAMTVDNMQTFIGNCTLRWPVYDSGDYESNHTGGIKGYMFMKFFKVRCTQQPALGTQYKNATTPGITLAAMDPHRADKGVYQYYYIEI